MEANSLHLHGKSSKSRSRRGGNPTFPLRPSPSSLVDPLIFIGPVVGALICYRLSALEASAAVLCRYVFGHLRADPCWGPVVAFGALECGS